MTSGRPRGAAQEQGGEGGAAGAQQEGGGGGQEGGGVARQHGGAQQQQQGAWQWSWGGPLPPGVVGATWGSTQADGGEAAWATVSGGGTTWALGAVPYTTL
jgi:hypothetical protein